MINMMKISKPVLTNEFLLSSVQFTSLDSILFKNIKNVYEVNEKILLEYEHSSKIEASSRDWIGIFPRGWSTLQQYITFEWVSQSLPSSTSEQNKENTDIIRRTVNFCPKFHISSINANSFYQFVYISKQIEVLGVSSYFRFDNTNSSSTNLELECLVPASKLRSTSVSDLGILMGNNMPSTTSLETRTLQTTSIHSLQNQDADKIWGKPPISLISAETKKAAILPRKATGTGDALDPYSSHSEPVFPMSFHMSQCKKCFHFKRGGEFVRSHQVLQSKVGPRLEGMSELDDHWRTLGHEMSEDKLKIVMERNKVLEERTQDMKNEMERLQAESKKLKMSFYNANKEKVAYEKFVKDFIKSLEKDSIVRVVNCNTEILVKRVNYVGMEEHPRGKKTSKRERELKAVIGLQEITIRNLINSLQEKAKSAQELNQTVKLAQAFSSARSDSRNYGSDVEEELDEVSNSDMTSDYEFSLTKPQPPEETAVEETDAILDDIRRTSEMELKDVGINRSLQNSTSQESEVELPNISVHSYHNQSEIFKSKKPRLLDNLEDCWTFPEDTPKTIHRKIIESSPREDDENEGITSQVSNSEMLSEEIINESDETGTEAGEPELSTYNENFVNSEDQGNHDDYYDAYEDNEASINKSGGLEESTFQCENDETKKEKPNFLVTAIIPQDAKSVQEEENRNMNTEVVEKKVETSSKKGKKFTCELSIDFSSKAVHDPSKEIAPIVVDKGSEETSHEICKNFDALSHEPEANPEKPLVTFKKANQYLEIKISQVDQKEAFKNLIQQKMTVKFGKDYQPDASSTKVPKFEFNVALSGVDKNSIKSNPTDMNDYRNRSSDVKSGEAHADVNISPRTIWNDATDNPVDDDVFESEEGNDEVIPQLETENEPDEKQSIISEDLKEESQDTYSNMSNMKSCEDSLRYEKNLEFLKNNINESIKDDEGVVKDKPSAILIQNGQTKLALIRYQ